jgi:hypothetical protein
MTTSNLAFYANAQATLSRSFPEHHLYFAKCLRIAEVVRYNPESTNIGSTVINRDSAQFEIDFYTHGERKLMNHAWFMEIAGTEYMLELIQPTVVDARLELFKLQTDTWGVKFNLRSQNVQIAAQTGQLMLKYMNQYVFLRKFIMTGSIEQLENNVTMFELLNADLAPQPIKRGV